MQKKIMKSSLRIDRNLPLGTRYIVEPGDNLYDIASRFDIDINLLKEMNHLSSNLIQPGQLIVVDSIYSEDALYDFDEYVVKKGDNLNTIAFKYNMTSDELMEINNKLNDKIIEGERLFIYHTDKDLANEVYYTVKPKDSLYSIAKKFHITVDDIKRLNNLDGEKLEKGKEIIVLNTDMIKQIRENAEVYFVLPGDTLYSIARMRDTSVEKLMALNQLTNTSLSIGQKILIPHINPIQKE